MGALEFEIRRVEVFALVAAFLVGAPKLVVELAHVGRANFSALVAFRQFRRAPLQSFHHQRGDGSRPTGRSPAAKTIAR